MSLITFSSLVSSIRGAIGSQTFRTSGSRSVVSNSPRRVKGLTEVQQTRALMLQQFNEQWRGMGAADWERWRWAISNGRSGRDKYLGYCMRFFYYAVSDYSGWPAPMQRSPSCVPVLMADSTEALLVGFDPIVKGEFSNLWNAEEPVPESRASARGNVVVTGIYGSSLVEGNFVGGSIFHPVGNSGIEIGFTEIASVWSWEGWYLQTDAHPANPTVILAGSDYSFRRAAVTGNLMVITPIGSMTWAGSALLVGSVHHLAVSVDESTGDVYAWQDGAALGLKATTHVGTQGGGVTLYGWDTLPTWNFEGDVMTWSLMNQAWDDAMETARWNGGVGSEWFIGDEVVAMSSSVVLESGQVQTYVVAGFSVTFLESYVRGAGAFALEVLQWSSERLARCILRVLGHRVQYGWDPGTRGLGEVTRP
jgi:hypothetical protein